MGRKNLMAAGILSVLLASSACGAGTGIQNPSAEPVNSATAGVGDESSTPSNKTSAEIGVLRKATAEKAKADPKSPMATQATPASPAAAPTPALAPEAPKPAPTLPALSPEQIVTTTYTTAYTWYDNTPAGSAAVSHPVLHTTAGGTGTYGDPITIAVGHSLATGSDVLDFPAGTRIYLPNVRRYFIVEDTCGDGSHPENGPCHLGANANGSNSTIWIDMWIDGKSWNADDADKCARKVTGVHTAVFNPRSNYAVAQGAGVIHDGICDAGYGNTLIKQ